MFLFIAFLELVPHLRTRSLEGRYDHILRFLNKIELGLKWYVKQIALNRYRSTTAFTVLTLINPLSLYSLPLRFVSCYRELDF